MKSKKKGAKKESKTNKNKEDNNKRERSRENSPSNNKEKIENKDKLDNTNPVKENKSSLVNNSWKIYYDPNYKQNFYYNPFTNESVWELPEGAKVSSNEVLTITTENDKNEKKEEKKEEEVPYNELENVDEAELKEKLIWLQYKKEQLAEWMKRPARQQVADTRKDTAYIEGNYDYNIWYDKYLTDRKEEKEKIAASTKCNPALDTGYTRADSEEKKGSAYFCLFFAKGCCSEGANCHYYHRVPTMEDAQKIENLRDIFGRSRFANPLKDYGGVGVFTKECRTLIVTDLKRIESKKPIKDMVKIIYDNFSLWGEIEDINYIPIKSCCYIRYEHRCFAEFAKEAMMKQSLVGEEIISVKWAFDDPNPMAEKIIQKEEENAFVSAVRGKYLNNNNQQEEIVQNCTKLQEYLNDIQQYKEGEDD